MKAKWKKCIFKLRKNERPKSSRNGFYKVVVIQVTFGKYLKIVINLDVLRIQLKSRSNIIFYTFLWFSFTLSYYTKNRYQW